MSEPGSRRGRVHDAEGAREAILNAAEEVFAEHGFDGARIDAIAAQAGYNKSLIFQYFGDKLNLYAEVTRRADREMSVLQASLLAPLLANENIASDASQFRVLLTAIVGAIFDQLAERPRLARILLWEQAEGWQTYKKIFSQLNTDDIDMFEKVFHTARKAGLLRSDFSPIVQLMMVLQMCLSYLASRPLYEVMLPDEDFSSAESLESAKTYIVNIIVAGMMADPVDTH
jgi:TetR/AcrR family transcriptional regulator